MMMTTAAHGSFGSGGGGEVFLQGMNLMATHEFLEDYNLLTASAPSATNNTRKCVGCPSTWIPHSGVVGDLFKLSAQYFSWLDEDTCSMGGVYTSNKAIETPGKSGMVHTVISPQYHDNRHHHAAMGSYKQRGASVTTSSSGFHNEHKLLENAELESHLTFQQVCVGLYHTMRNCYCYY